MSTIKDDGGIISSGVTSNGTIRDRLPIIPSGVFEPLSQQAHIISAGIGDVPDTEIVLNNKKYKILQLIHSLSGEAELYLVEKENQKYILKCYYPNFKPKESILSELKEMHHPDIVELIDYGYYGNKFFEVMEYAQGGSFMDVAQDGTYKYIPVKDINRIKLIVKEISNAFYFCHSKGIIHRDIKPENIFFRNLDGTDIIIGDFGISSALDEGLSNHMTGQARTEIYAAPELYQSISGKTIISNEVDYYALGITLIHIWSGEEPFKELSPYAIMKVKCDSKVDIPDDMPEELETLTKGLITVEPSKRWGYEEIQKWLSNEYVPVYYKTGVETRYSDFHFGIIGGEDIVVNDPVELTKLLEKYPDIGKKHLYKGTIAKWVIVNQAFYIGIVGIVEDEYPQDQDAGLIKATYLLNPYKNFKTDSGVECKTAEDAGDAFEKEEVVYRNVLTQKENCEFYLYLEARGFKSEVETFRKYAKTFGSDKAFNTIILELQGKDKFKIDNLVFYKPEDLFLTDESIKDKLVRLLKDPDSKLSIWLEQFPDLKNNIDKWRKLGRYNNVTLSYALEEKSPFHFKKDLAYHIAEFENLFAKYISDERFLIEMTTPNSPFVEEADFWLKNYLTTFGIKESMGYNKVVEDVATTLESMLKLLGGNVCLGYNEVVEDFIKKDATNVDKGVFNKLVEYIIETKPDVDSYCDNIKPCVDMAYTKEIISEGVFKKQKDFLLKNYEDVIKQAIVTTDYKKKEEEIGKIRKLDPVHRLVRRHDNEGNLFPFLREKASKELEEKKNSDLEVVRRDIEERIEERKEKAKKKYRELHPYTIGGTRVGCFGGIIGFWVGIICFNICYYNGISWFKALIVAPLIFPFIFCWLGRGLVGGIRFLKQYAEAEKSAAQVTILPNEEMEIESVEKKFTQQIANLDIEIRKSIYKMTDEEVGKNIERITMGRKIYPPNP